MLERLFGRAESNEFALAEYLHPRRVRRWLVPKDKRTKVNDAPVAVQRSLRRWVQRITCGRRQHDLSWRQLGSPLSTVFPFVQQPQVIAIIARKTVNRAEEVGKIVDMRSSKVVCATHDSGKAHYLGV